MWTRSDRPGNMVINDPKGELLKKFYVPATYRGYQIVQFNLINPMNTDIYNPLILASGAAQEGDFQKCASYVSNIADVFFPTDSGDDPVWPNAANNAFKRAAYGLTDYYLEEEKELRRKARATGMDAKVLDSKIDRLWGHVTLYNCYQMFVQLTSKKLDNPLTQYEADRKSGELEKQLKAELADKGITEDDPQFKDKEVELAQKKADKARAQSVLWDNQPEQDELTLFFNATDALPKNSMRQLVADANNSLKSMAGAEKMLSSCDLLFNEKLDCA